MRPIRPVALVLFILSACSGNPPSNPLDAGPGEADGAASDTPSSDALRTDVPATDAPPSDGGSTGRAPTVTICPGDALPPLAMGTCAVTAGTAGTLITGDVLTPGEVFRGGQVLVDAEGVIRCVGCDCSAAAGAADDEKRSSADTAV